MTASGSTGTTTYLAGLLYSAVDYLSLRKKQTPGVGYYKSLSTAEMFHSKKAADQTQFFQEIEAATAIAKASPKKKCWIDLGPTNGLVIYDPKDIREIWGTHKDCLDSKESVNLFGHYFGKDVIMALSTEDPKYAKLRKLFDETFLRREGVAKLIPTIHAVTETYVAQYGKAGKMDLKEFGSRLTQTTILKGAIKAEVKDSTKDKLAHLIDGGINHAVELRNIVAVAFGAYTPWKTVRTKASDYTDKAKKLILEEIIAPNNIPHENPLSANAESWLYKRVTMEKERLAQLSRFAKVSGFFRSLCYGKAPTPSVTSDASILELAFLTTAGSETTTNHFALTFLALLKHPEVLKKLTADIDAIKKHPRDMDEKDFASLKYLDCVIMESLRLLSPLNVRKIAVCNDITLSDGTKIKAGDHIYVNVKETHRSKQHYPDRPDEFVPERFAEADLNKVLLAGSTEAWQPFGRLRPCPGRLTAVEEMRKALVYILYHFDMRLNQEWELTHTKTTFGSTPHSASGKPFEVELVPRAASNATAATDISNDAKYISKIHR